MVAARKRSAKRSATSGGGPPERLTFFVDECLGRKALPDALVAAGHGVVLHHERFAPGTDDVDWLTALHEHRGFWVVLTKDRKIRRRPLERLAIMNSGLRVFALTAGDLTFEAQTQAFVSGLKRIVQLARAAGPFIAGITASGHVKVIDRPKPRQRKGRTHRAAARKPRL
jgi:hypothetical protein